MNKLSDSAYSSCRLNEISFSDYVDKDYNITIDGENAKLIIYTIDTENSNSEILLTKYSGILYILFLILNRYNSITRNS